MHSLLLLSVLSTATPMVADSQPQLSRRPPILRPSPRQALPVLISQRLPVDPIRAAELRERALVGETKQHELDEQARRKERERQFTEKFNKFVDAVNRFANQYNEGHGEVWPRREAENLRKTFQQLQQVEKALHDASDAPPARPSSTAAPVEPRQPGSERKPSGPLQTPAGAGSDPESRLWRKVHLPLAEML